MASKQIKEEDFDNKKHVKEYKRTCKECGKVWHSLVDREQQVAFDSKLSNVQGCLSACGDSGTSAQHTRNEQANKEALNNLRSCPACKSSNYEEKLLIYEKK